MTTQLEILIDRKTRKGLIIASVLLLLLGLAGIVAPQIMSLVVAAFVGWLMLFGGIMVGYFTWRSFSRRWSTWLKAAVLVITGALILFNPLAGAAALGLVLAIYFMMDGFAGVTLAWELKPNKGWGWLMFNGILSLALAAIFLIGWPFSSAWLVGFFIGISLFMDGWTLLMIALAARQH
jgi:uncharacterized membrane protein HdeD (DUF308 family)